MTLFLLWRCLTWGTGPCVCYRCVPVWAVDEGTQEVSSTSLWVHAYLVPLSRVIVRVPAPMSALKGCRSARTVSQMTHMAMRARFTKPSGHQLLRLLCNPPFAVLHTHGTVVQRKRTRRVRQSAGKPSERESESQLVVRLFENENIVSECFSDYKN